MSTYLDKFPTIRKPYAGLDVGKFICAFVILFYHYFSEHGPLPGILDEFLSSYAIAVALFMTISGFLIFDKLETVQGTSQRWAVVFKQVKRIFIIYLLWSIPYLVYTVARWDFEAITASFVLWQIQGWVFQSTFYTIWFMPVLAIGLILTFWLTEKLPEKVTITLALLMYIVGALTVTYKYFGDKIPGFSYFSEFAKTWLGGTRGWLLYAFPLLMVGRLMVKFKSKIKPIFCAIAACTCVVLMLDEGLLLRSISGGHTGIDMTIMMIPASFFCLGFLISVKLPYGNYCLWMRKMSTLVFMSQRLFLTVLPACFPLLFGTYVFSNKYIGALIVTALCVGFSALIIALSEKIKPLAYLY